MKFVHIADCHLGSWRDEKLRNLGLQNFKKVIDYCLFEQVDCLLIAGDLFNTALPSIDTIKLCVQQLQRLKDKNIPVYLIAGSHDYSPSGKTMLDVLEEAQLITNVMRADVDETLKLKPTQGPDCNIYGILGRAQTLEKTYFHLLDKNSVEPNSVFLFHTGVSELIGDKSGFFDTIPLSAFPKKCTYYAGGHIHIRLLKKIEEYGTFGYPGPLFPNSVSELEVLQKGSFIVGDTIKDEYAHKFLEQHDVVTQNINVTNKTEQEVCQEIKHINCDDTIIILRLTGTTTKPLHVSEAIDYLYEKGAFYVLKTSKIELETTTINQTKAQTPQQVEEEMLGNLPNKELIKNILHEFNTEKKEGETVNDFENRIHQLTKQVFDIDTSK